MCVDILFSALRVTAQVDYGKVYNFYLKGFGGGTCGLRKEGFGFAVVSSSCHCHCPYQRRQQKSFAKHLLTSARTCVRTKNNSMPASGALCVCASVRVFVYLCGCGVYYV